MSDLWELFSRQLGQHRAYIVYDHGIGKDIDKLPLPMLLKIRVTLRSPRADGLPQSDEFEALAALEAALDAEIEKLGGAFVGRITLDGKRIFHIFLDVGEKAVVPLIAGMRQGSGYEVDFLLQSDPEKNGYWADLFPTKYERRVIKDQKLLTVIKQEGDNPEILRRIDHWTFFPGPTQRDAFKAWIEEAGFSVDRAYQAADSFCLQIFHDFKTASPGISNCTFKLMEKAEECGGVYDGWETSVERGDASKTGS